MNIVGIVVLCLICACLSSVFKRYNKEYAVLLSFVTGSMILLQLLRGIQENNSAFSDLIQAAQGADEYFSVLWKAAVICMVTRFAADSCADAGQKALASQVELAGKAAVILMAIPLFSGLAQVILSLAGG